MNYKRLLSGALLIMTVSVSFKHIFKFFSLGMSSPGLAAIGASYGLILAIMATGIVSSLLVLFRRTFVGGNILHIILATFLGVIRFNAGKTEAALMEVPFIASYILLIYLGYPLPKRNLSANPENVGIQ